jgi:hypothetical protein
MPGVVAASPAPNPLAAQRTFLEREALFRGCLEHVHASSIALACDNTEQQLWRDIEA